jgi:hypothetical protein
MAKMSFTLEPDSVDGGCGGWAHTSASHVAGRMGSHWKIGRGDKVRFWEDNWLGSSSLSIQFWKLYKIVNEKNATID